MTPSPAVVRQPGPGETSPTHHLLDAGEGQGQEGAAGSSHEGPGDGGRRTRPRLEEEEEDVEDDDQQQQQPPPPIDDAAHHLLGEGFGALPLEIARDQVLPYLDGRALAQWGGASHTTRAQVNRDEEALWRNLVEKEYGWLFGKRLPRYLTPAEFYAHLRRATASLVGADPQGANIWDPLHQWRPGRLVCVGGSLYRPRTLKNVDAFADTGGARMVPGGWPCPFKRIGRPHLRTRRSAVGLVRDWDDGLWVLGGWGGQGQQERALTSTETWTVERLGQEGLGAEESAVEHVVDSGDEEEGTLPGVEDSQEEEGAGGQQGEGVGEAVVEEQNPDGQGEAADDGRARWQPQWARSREWVIRSDMQTPRCFLAATMDPAGGILAIGGGESIWQGAQVYASTELFDAYTDLYGPWTPGPNMAAARCGHAAGVGDNHDVYVMGGYGGGTNYLASVEVLPGGVIGEQGRGFVPLEEEGASMSAPRTGFAMSKGPDRAFYVAGGSPDGIRSHKTAERFDPREGRWQPLPSMITPRGYCSGAFAASGLFYVAGGQATDDFLLPSVECFDPRAGRWRLLPASIEQGVGLTRVDLAMMYTLF